MKKTAETKQHIPYIDNPEELRKLSPEQLPEVCADIRKCIIENLSSNPGHFASSMGAVEIIVALHYVMNTPDDKLVWTWVIRHTHTRFSPVAAKISILCAKRAD